MCIYISLRLPVATLDYLNAFLIFPLFQYSRASSDVNMVSLDSQLVTISEMIKTCAFDVRDKWPTNADNYTKSETIVRGTFGIVRLAEASDPSFQLDGLATRSCVIKTIYLRRRIEAVYKEISSEGEDTNAAIEINNQIFRLHRSIVMELFILSRCRHANIMHLHAVFMTDGGDMHIVLPRFYVLEHLIRIYKHRNQSEPIPIAIIAKVLRQLCLGLDFLQRAGIAHRDIQPENIFITRNGTVKLGHFSQACPIFENVAELHACRTPVGKEEFMSFEKQHNLYLRKINGNFTTDDSLEYSFSADIWSLGVLVLNMVSYFPDEQCQKLHKNFALAMQQEQMPFIWLTVDMLQLRSRLVKCGGDKLKLFLSDRLLTVKPEHRATAATLLKTPEMKQWCMNNIEEDAAYLRNYFINEVDFANQMKLDNDAPNYDALETKDIPAEFYWSDQWKHLEDMELWLHISISNSPNEFSRELIFRFSDPEPFFRLLYEAAGVGHLDLTDILAVDYEIKQIIFDFVRLQTQTQQNTTGSKDQLFIQRQIHLFSHSESDACENIRKILNIEIRQLKDVGGRRLRLNSESP